ncbi:hypothetical protein LJR016_004326 [Devosia sp. LjRoot16]
MIPIRRFISRAKPSCARLISSAFPRFFLLLESGDHLLLESGDKIILG